MLHTKRLNSIISAPSPQPSPAPSSQERENAGAVSRYARPIGQILKRLESHAQNAETRHPKIETGASKLNANLQTKLP